MQSIISEIAAVYKASKKQQDIFWNIYIARPLAAIIVAFLRRTPITPNQVTFLGIGIFFIAAAVLALWTSWWGLFIGVCLIQFSYLFDCADGQLARLKNMTSEVGSYLDFLMDEIKAFLLVAGFSIRLYLINDDLKWLIVGIMGVILVAVGTSLTSFVRRPEYCGKDIKPGESAKRKPRPSSLPGLILWYVERTAQWLVHYPSWILYIALLDLFLWFDGAAWFLYLYLGVYLVYVGKTSLSIFIKLAHPGYYRS